MWDQKGNDLDATGKGRVIYISSSAGGHHEILFFFLASRSHIEGDQIHAPLLSLLSFPSPLPTTSATGPRLRGRWEGYTGAGWARFGRSSVPWAPPSLFAMLWLPPAWTGSVSRARQIPEHCWNRRVPHSDCHRPRYLPSVVPADRDCPDGFWMRFLAWWWGTWRAMPTEDRMGLTRAAGEVEEDQGTRDEAVVAEDVAVRRFLVFPWGWLASQADRLGHSGMVGGIATRGWENGRGDYYPPGHGRPRGGGSGITVSGFRSWKLSGRRRTERRPSGRWERWTSLSLRGWWLAGTAPPRVGWMRSGDTCSAFDADKCPPWWRRTLVPVRPAAHCVSGCWACSSVARLLHPCAPVQYTWVHPWRPPPDLPWLLPLHIHLRRHSCPC